MFPPCIPEPLTQECMGEGERATDCLHKPEGGETNLATCALVLVWGAPAADTDRNCGQHPLGQVTGDP